MLFEYQQNYITANWTENDMERALEKVKRGELSIRGTGMLFGIPESTIRSIKNQIEEFPDVAPGRKQYMSKDVEASLTECIKVLCENGFSPTVEEVLQLVKEYNEKNRYQIDSSTTGRADDGWIILCQEILFL